MEILNTPCGAIRGVPGRVPGTVAYKGIRYATAGRWELPREVTHWDGVFDGSGYGHCSYQPRRMTSTSVPVMGTGAFVSLRGSKNAGDS